MLEEFENKIEELQAYKEIIEMLEQRETWYDAENGCRYDSIRLECLAKVKKAVAKMANII